MTKVAFKNPIHLYIAGCTTDGGIYHYQCAGDDILLCEKTLADRPMYLQLRENHLFAILRQPKVDDPNSTVTSWVIGPEGALGTEKHRWDTLGRCGCHLWVGPQYTYVVNYLTGNVVRLPDEKHDQHHDHSKEPHTHCILPTPDGNFLVVTDLGLDRIYLYDMDLQVVQIVSVPENYGPRHVCFSEDGQYMFCANELHASVSSFRYGNGKLTYVGTFGHIQIEGDTAAAIRQEGKYVYVSHRGADCIMCLEIQADGQLVQRSVTPCGGQSPRDFNIEGDWLFCVNEKTNNLTCFVRDGAQLVPYKTIGGIDHPIAIVCAAE